MFCDVSPYLLCFEMVNVGGSSSHSLMALNIHELLVNSESGGSRHEGFLISNDCFS